MRRAAHVADFFVFDGNVALADGCGAMLEEALEEAAADEVPLALEQGAGDVRVVAVPCDGVAIGEDGLKTVGAVGLLGLLSSALIEDVLNFARRSIFWLKLLTEQGLVIARGVNQR